MLTIDMIGRGTPCLGAVGGTVVPDLDRVIKARDAEGAFSGVVHGADGEVTLARDPLGLGKLFWVERDGRVLTASNPSTLTDRGVDFSEIRSFPANLIATYHPNRATARTAPAPSPTQPAMDEAGSIDQAAVKIRASAESYIEGILAQRPGPAVVALSGGLDSTSVAAMVREHRADAIAVTFDLRSLSDTEPSDDYLTAQQAARYLDLCFEPVICRPSQILDLVDLVLTAGADWRDFNVHAGLVNAALAHQISLMLGDEVSTATVFTGDLVNEFLADYTAETYQGTAYYSLPRLAPNDLRDALVRGISTVHREIGIFDAFQLTVAQPYAAARRHLLDLPAGALGPGDGKRLLYQAMFGTRLPASTYWRPKTRAQTGSAGPDHRGVLAACVDAGIDAAWLGHRFAHLHRTNAAAMGRFLRGGRYRTGIPGDIHATKR